MNKMFWVRAAGEKEGSRYGYVERIELSTGEKEYFDEAAGKINLLCLEPHIGEVVEVYRDGVLSETNILDDVSPDDDRNGVMTAWMKPINVDTEVNA